MILKKLTQLGLNDKESVCYLALLENGTSQTTFISKKTDLKRSTAYLALHGLLKKGLVTKNVKNKVQYFSACDPAYLDNWLERKKSEIETQRNSLQDFLGELYERISPISSKPKIRFFEGTEGARTALEETLNAEEKFLRVLLSVADIIEFLGEKFFLDYTDKRIQRGPELRAIRTVEKDLEVLTDKERAKNYITSKKARREIRYISDDLTFPVSTYAFDDKLIYISSKKENFAVMIQSQEIANMQKKMFEILWGTAKPYSDKLFSF